MTVGVGDMLYYLVEGGNSKFGHCKKYSQGLVKIFKNNLKKYSK